MITSPLEAVYGPQVSSGSGDAQVGSQEFMHLLTTKLKNQNPLEPMEDADFLGQVAQFSGLEESQAQTQALQDLAQVMLQNSSLQGLSQASSLIGKQVTFIDPLTQNEGLANVKGVRFSSGGIMLDLDGENEIPMGNVLAISEDPEQSGV